MIPQIALAHLRLRTASSSSDEGTTNVEVPGALLGNRAPRTERSSGGRRSGDSMDVWIQCDKSLKQTLVKLKVGSQACGNDCALAWGPFEADFGSWHPDKVAYCGARHFAEPPCARRCRVAVHVLSNDGSGYRQMRCCSHVYMQTMRSRHRGDRVTPEDANVIRTTYVPRARLRTTWQAPRESQGLTRANL